AGRCRTCPTRGRPTRSTAASASTKAGPTRMRTTWWRHCARLKRRIESEEKGPRHRATEPPRGRGGAVVGDLSSALVSLAWWLGGSMPRWLLPAWWLFPQKADTHAHRFASTRFLVEPGRRGPGGGHG